MTVHPSHSRPATSPAMSTRLLGVYRQCVERGIWARIQLESRAAPFRGAAAAKATAAALATAAPLKVPKRENFSLAFFAQSEPTWVCDLGSGGKNRIFYQMTPVFDGFLFFAAY
jgi:hypothetical protein